MLYTYTTLPCSVSQPLTVADWPPTHELWLWVSPFGSVRPGWFIKQAIPATVLAMYMYMYLTNYLPTYLAGWLVHITA